MLYFSRWLQKRREKRRSVNETAAGEGRHLIENIDAREAYQFVEDTDARDDCQLVQDLDTREGPQLIEETTAREVRQLIEETEARENHQVVENIDARDERQICEQAEAHEERQLFEETEAREAETQIHPDKRDDQQPHALLELQRTMDPLVAAQVYNYRLCPLISRLPEELFLCIFEFLRDDPIVLRCLRIASRLFLRLLNSQSAVWTEVCSIRGEAVTLQDVQFRRLLQRDGRCEKCRRWNDARGNKLLDDCKFQQRFRRSPIGAVDYLLYGELYCHACDSIHDNCQFSSAYQQSLTERRCLGQQGSVKLCEHIQITWDRIKTHINNWRQLQRGRGGWQACIDSFNIECHDASHDTRCEDSQAPTWPRARLDTSTLDPDIVVLNLEWTPHSRIDARTLTPNGQLPAPELRALFHSLRSQGPADNLFPASLPGALPEMALFSPSSRIGSFVYYKTGEDVKMKLAPPLYPPLPDLVLSSLHRHGKGRNGKKLVIKPHYPKDACGTGISAQCLVVSYEKDIMICKTTAMTDLTIKLIPTDHWLHAMDVQTYPHPQGRNIRPQCRDITCTNYYRIRKDRCFCPTWQAPEPDIG